MQQDIDKAQETQTVSEPVKKTKKLKVIVITAISILVLLLIFLSIHALAPSFSLLLALGIPIGLAVIGGVVYGIVALITWYRNKSNEPSNNLPRAATPEEIENKIKKYFVERRENHVKKITFSDPDTSTGNAIYNLEVELYHPDEDGNPDSKKIYAIVNANYLNERPIIIKSFDTSQSKISRIMNKHSTTPKESPDTMIETERNPALGVEIVRKRTTHRLNDKEKKRKEAEIG